MWSLEELVRLTKSDDTEVRYWAVDRLIRHFPTDSCDAIVGLLLDDHDSTPTAVARHLGRHGGSRHQPALLRGYKLLRGLTPGFCLEALGRLGHPGVVDLARSALKRGDLTDAALGILVETLADLGTREAVGLDARARRVAVACSPAAGPAV